MRNLLHLIALASVIPAVTAMAAGTDCDDVIPTPVLPDSAGSVLRNNAPLSFSSAPTPSFVFTSRNGKFMFGAGGNVKVTMGMDIGHPIPLPDEFITSQIPMRDMEGNGAAFNISAQQTHLYLNFVALPGTRNEVGAFVSANLLNNYAPSLRHAYLRFRGFQAGYDYTLFFDPYAGPPTIDFEGPNANTAIPVAGIRYGFDFGKHKEWNLSVGAELPFQSYTVEEGRTASVSQRVPDIPVALRYSWDNGAAYMRLAGVIRNLYFRKDIGTPGAVNVDKIGGGIQLSGGLSLTPDLVFFCQGVYGKGIASYIQDLYGEGMDLCPSPDGSTLDAVKVWGASGGLQYSFSPKVYCSATYSHVRTYADKYEGGATDWNSQYRYAQYAAANVFYNISPYFRTGLEYIWGRRANYDGIKCADQRIQALFQVSF